MSLAFRSAGLGGRPLVLLHGLAGRGSGFDDQVRLLAAAGWHAVAPDLRGHGDSPKPEHEDDYALAALAQDVLDLADGLGWHRFDVFGHELGGAVAQELALGAAHRVGALVLQSTAPGPFPLVRGLAEGGVELVRGAGIEALVATTRHLGGFDRDPGAEDAMRATAGPAYASLLSQLLDAPDRSLRLAELQVRTLVVAGEEDGAYVDAARDLAAIIPGATLGVLPGAGHRPHVDTPVEWRIFVTGFLGAVRV